MRKLKLRGLVSKMAVVALSFSMLTTSLTANASILDGLKRGYGVITTKVTLDNPFKKFEGLGFGEIKMEDVLSLPNVVKLDKEKDKSVILNNVGWGTYEVSPGIGMSDKIYYVSEKESGSNRIFTQFMFVSSVEPKIQNIGGTDLKGYVANADTVEFYDDECPGIGGFPQFIQDEEAYNYLINESSSKPEPPVKPEDPKPEVPKPEEPSVPEVKPFTSIRLGGLDRFATSIEIAKAFQNGSMLSNVVVANYTDFPDALSGSALAKSLDAPILLTGARHTPNSVTAEYIKSNLKKDGTVYLLGGEGVVPNAFVNELKSAGYSKFVRLGGLDRYDTNLEIVKAMNVTKGTPIFVANSTMFADSLSASPISAINGMPILLVKNNEIPQKTLEMIKNISPTHVYVVGGDGVVSKHVSDVLSGLAPVTRLGGLDRYDTGLAVNRHFNLDTENAIIASGVDFPDALTGSVLAAKLNAPIVLVRNGDLGRQKSYIDSTRMRKLTIIGGTGVVSDSTIKELKK